VFRNPGAGIAPWNVQKYSFYLENGIPKIIQNDSNATPVIFFHFHGTKIFQNGFGVVINFPMTFSAIEVFFITYSACLYEKSNEIYKAIGSFLPGTFANVKEYNLKDGFNRYRDRDFSGNEHIYQYVLTDATAWKSLKNISIFLRVKNYRKYMFSLIKRSPKIFSKLFFKGKFNG